MSKKVFRVHTFESVYVGPTEPHITFPPTEVLTNPERVGEWSLEELDGGDVLVTHKNPRARSYKQWDPKQGREVSVMTPNGQAWSTRIPAANIKDVQYEMEPIQAAKTKGAA